MAKNSAHISETSRKSSAFERISKSQLGPARKTIPFDAVLPQIATSRSSFETLDQLHCREEIKKIVQESLLNDKIRRTNRLAIAPAASRRESKVSVILSNDQLNMLRRKSLAANRLQNLEKERSNAKPRFSMRTLIRVAIIMRRKAFDMKLINRLDEFDMVPYVRAFASIMVKEEPDDGIVFQKGKFKANKELLVLPQKALNILERRFRTDDEVRFLVRCMRILKQFNEYPESVQEKLAHKLVYQKYEEKRLLLRESHRPEGMYFVVTGRAVELTMDYDGYSARPSFIAEQGDVFGESAIAQGIPRPKTWISQTPITLLYLRSEDYLHIFNVASSLRKPQAEDAIEESKLEEFLKTLRWFQEWPISILHTNRSKHTFQMFKKNAVIEEHVSSSPWLYVVVSGSISVMKRLKKVVPKDFDNEQDMFTIGGARHGLLKLDYTHQIGIHEDWFDRVYLEVGMYKTKERRRLKLREENVKLPSLYELTTEGTNLSMNQSRASQRRDEEAAMAGNLQKPSQANRNLVSVGQQNLQMMLQMLGKTDASTTNQTKNTEPKLHKEVTVATTVTRDGSASSSRTGSTIPAISRENSSSVMARSRTNSEASIGGTTTNRTTKMSSRRTTSKHRNHRKKQEYVTIDIETLERGQLFGGAHLVHENQPDLLLMTKNGAELFMLDKDLFRKNATDHLLTDMVKAIAPYPTERQLQHRLQTFTDWEKYRNEVIDNAISKRVRQSLPVLPNISLK